MKNIIVISLFAGCVAALVAIAGPTPGPGGLSFVRRADDSLAGSGTKPIPLIVELVSDGGIDYVPDGGLRVSASVATLINVPSISVSQTTGGVAVNLSTVGTTDWLMPETSTDFPIATKITGGLRLSSPYPYAVAAANSSTITNTGNCISCPHDITWNTSDTTYQTGPQHSTSKQVICTSGCVGVGWFFDISTETHSQVLRQYMSVTGTTGYQCDATFNDGSASASSPSLNPGSGTIYNTLVWTFTGGHIKTRLRIYCHSTGTITGGGVYVTWYGEALSPT